MDTTGAHDWADAAERADLVYVSDTEPGYRRRRAGRGFYYLDTEDGRVGDAEVIARIDGLAIPPAWTQVWISTEPTAHIQATGRDQRGRKQYRYHPAWTSCRDEAKFSSLSAFARALPKLREAVDADLRKRGLPRERVIATVVHLLDQTLIRVGNDAYAQDNKSFGLTTLRARHLEVTGSSLRFSFTGKSGKEWKLKLADRRIAAVVRSIQELPGQRLFQYLDDDGKRHDVRSQDVNDYIRAAIGPAFTSKHFRTWGATVSAALALGALPLPETKTQTTRELNAVLDEVAKLLRNTRAVCRRCYVHPALVEAWLDGALHDEMRTMARKRPRALKGLDEEETAVLRWLQAREA